LSLGEMEDVALSEEMNLDKQKYMDMIYKKTAVLEKKSLIILLYLCVLN
jgi:octaprenyl-diphosphate synthase